jgi:hypothetical protein
MLTWVFAVSDYGAMGPRTLRERIGTNGCQPENYPSGWTWPFECVHSRDIDQHMTRGYPSLTEVQ